MGLMGCQYDREKLDQWQEVVDSRDHVRKKKSSTGVHIFFFYHHSNITNYKWWRTNNGSM